jgi:MarR family transcriptional regulator, lower aerobic nicotinate degradation pathway regulator
LPAAVAMAYSNDISFPRSGGFLMVRKMRVHTRPPRYVVDDQIGFILRVAVQFHTAIFLGRMLEGLTQAQFGTLVTLHQFTACSQSELGKYMQLDSATINGVVDRLKQRGLLRIEDDPADRRRTLVTLTPKGKRLVDTVVPIGHEITRETLGRLTQAEQTRLIRLLRKMSGEVGGNYGDGI